MSRILCTNVKKNSKVTLFKRTDVKTEISACFSENASQKLVSIANSTYMQLDHWADAKFLWQACLWSIATNLMKTGFWDRSISAYHQSWHQKIYFRMVVQLIQQKEGPKIMRYFFLRVQQELFKCIKQTKNALIWEYWRDFFSLNLIQCL